MNLRILSIGISAVVLLGMLGIVLYGWSGVKWNELTWVNLLYDLPLLLLIYLLYFAFPPVVSIVLSACSKSPVSQTILLGTSLLYGVLFLCVIDFSFHPKMSIVLLFIGGYSLPVLLPLWFTALVIEIRYRKKRQQVAAEP